MSSSTAYRVQPLWIIALGIAALLPACAAHSSKPPQVSITQIEPYTRAAKAPDCSMPVLYSEPKGKYLKIAIVEGWASSDDQQAELLAALQRKACETGADALLIVQQRSQSTNSMLNSGELQAGTEEAMSNSGLDIATRRKKSDHFTQPGELGYRGYYIDAAATIIGDRK